jgi:hypothetical protein
MRWEAFDKGRPASIDAAQVRAMKAQRLGASEIAKALKIGRPSVYRVPDPPDAAPGSGSAARRGVSGTCGRNSAVGKRPRPERCNTGSRGPRWRMRRALYRCGTIARNCCDFPNHDPFRLTGRRAKFTGPEARQRQRWPGKRKGHNRPASDVARADQSPLSVQATPRHNLNQIRTRRPALMTRGVVWGW